jgi:HSP20 family molecular chaperone IbpA
MSVYSNPDRSVWGVISSTGPDRTVGVNLMRQEYCMHIDFNQSEGFEELSKMADRFKHCVKDAINDPDLAEKLRRFGSQFDTDFSHPFGQGAQSRDGKATTSPSPLMNSYKNSDGSIIFEFLLPGFDQAGIDIRFRGDTMFLTARLPEGPNEETKRRVTHQGFELKNHERLEFSVPADDYTQNQAKAVMRNGVLTITIPPKDAADDPNCIRVEILKEGN